LRAACDAGDKVTAKRIGGIMAAYAVAVDDKAERYSIAVRYLVMQRRKAAETAWLATL
jgi:ribosomal protein S7